jgi:multidrug efflux pump subunit AcrA (membrane-fusion protein)
LDDTYLNLDIETNSSEKESLSIDITYFKKEVGRFNKLLKQNSSTKSQFDTAQRNLDKSKAQYDALNVAYDILHERKKRLCINAPTGWRIIKRYVEPGKWVNVGEPVVEVGNYMRLSAPFALSSIEYQSLKKKEDQGITVYLPDLDTTTHAKLIRVSPAFDDESRKIHLELELDLSKNQKINRGGLRVDLDLDIPMHTGAILVPEKALTQRYEQYWLKRANGEEIAVVYLGRSKSPNDKWIRVVSPEITPGDKFIINNE